MNEITVKEQLFIRKWSKFGLLFQINGLTRKKFAQNTEPMYYYYEINSPDKWILFHRNMILYNLCNIVYLITLKKRTGIENVELEIEIENSEKEIQQHYEQKTLFEEEMKKKWRGKVNYENMTKEFSIFNYEIPIFMNLIEKLKETTELQDELENEFEKSYKKMFTTSIKYNILF